MPIINLARQHPQGTPFTKVVVELCSKCGHLEAEMFHQQSRSHVNTSDAPEEFTSHTCWDCFFTAD